jgi:hypothetical protein
LIAVTSFLTSAPSRGEESNGDEGSDADQSPKLVTMRDTGVADSLDLGVGQFAWTEIGIWLV